MNLPMDSAIFTKAQEAARSHGLEVEFLSVFINHMEHDESPESASWHALSEWDLLGYKAGALVWPWEA